jgi:enoyl-CoA hydratase/carnithine racemase
MSEVRYEVASHVASLTIDRPLRRNALDAAVLVELRRLVAQAVADPDVRVITLTGAGDQVFCAGADLKASSSGEEGLGGRFGRGEFRALLLELVNCPKPTVALARGHVMAGGLGLLLACDLALAADDIHVSTPEVQVGMFPMMVLALLFRNVGRKKAAELILLGERISAAEARELGIVNRVFARGAFEESAHDFVTKLASRSGEILRRGKAAMREVEGLPLDQQLERLEKALELLMATADSQEGIRAFLEKRPPRWSHS